MEKAYGDIMTISSMGNSRRRRLKQEGLFTELILVKFTTKVIRLRIEL